MDAGRSARRLPLRRRDAVHLLAAASGSEAEHYPGAPQVVVVGKTAGSVAAPIYGGLVADRLPRAKVVVFGAQSGAWPDDPDFNASILDGRWNAYRAVPAWATAGLGAAEWAVPRFWIQAGRHRPQLVLARFDYAYDPHAASEVTRWMPGTRRTSSPGSTQTSGPSRPPG